MKQHRKAQGLTQRQLGERLGVDESTISRWENGSKRINDVWVRRIAEILKCHPGELFEPISTVADNQEAELIQALRTLSPEARAMVLSRAGELAQRLHELDQVIPPREAG